MELPGGGCPWKEHLFNIEEEGGNEVEIKFVIFPDSTPDGPYRVQGVNKGLSNFELR